MTDHTQPWPRAQRMPLAIVGGRPQPWHQRAVAEYDAAHGTTTEPNSTIPGMFAAAQINNAIRWWNERADGMSTPLMHVTVHDQFKRGDTVRLVHTEGREFVTDSTLAVERDSTSVTFANVPSRIEFEVIVDRVDSASCPVTLKRSDAKTSASMQYRLLEEDTNALTGWPVEPGDVTKTWGDWIDAEDGETLVFAEDVSVQVRVKP